MSSALERILAEVGRPDLVDILADRLHPTDLQSLMLAVYARRSASRTPAEVLADYERSRFFGATRVARADLARVERAADAVLATHFEQLTLSPVTALGSCAAVARVAAGWSIPTARTGEVVSDPTNVLALEAALRRRQARHASGDAGTMLHLATVQRVVRPQAFASADMFAHFGLVALLSTGRDRGNHATEAEAIGLHVATHLQLIRTLVGAELSLSVSHTGGRGPDDPRLVALAQAAERFGASLWTEERAAVDGYYTGFCFHVWTGQNPATAGQIADGGVVDWTAKLLANAKERCVISGCGVERLADLSARA